LSATRAIQNAEAARAAGVSLASRRLEKRTSGVKSFSRHAATRPKTGISDLAPVGCRKAGRAASTAA